MGGCEHPGVGAGNQTWQKRQMLSAAESSLQLIIMNPKRNLLIFIYLYVYVMYWHACGGGDPDLLLSVKTGSLTEPQAC